MPARILDEQPTTINRFDVCATYGNIANVLTHSLLCNEESDPPARVTKSNARVDCVHMGPPLRRVDGGSKLRRGGSIPSVDSVKEYVVEMVTSTGEVITEKASTLADALSRICRNVFPEWDGNVKVNPDDPLKGTLRGTAVLSVVINGKNGKADKLTATLTDPPVFRRSVDSPWEVDPSAYPPAFRSHN